MNKADETYLESIELSGEQLLASYNEAKLLKLPKNFSDINKVLVVGMGGSQLGVDLINALFFDRLKYPITQIRGYKLPKYVDKKTLVILSSYSGSTEEVISGAHEAKKRGLKALAICTGGKLASLAKKYKLPIYLFDPIDNPSGQPRMGTSYTTGAVLQILKKSGALKITDSEVDNLAKYLVKSYKKYTKTKEVDNLAKKLKDKIIIYVTSEFLEGNGHIITNQTNESSKQLAYYYHIPELNHHLLEGLTFPKANTKLLHFVLVNSDMYLPRNQKRYKVMKEVLNKYKIKYSDIKLNGTKEEQVFSMLTFGALLSFKLTKLNKQDPTLIPWVDYFKHRMASK